MKMNIKDIPKLTGEGQYRVDNPLEYLKVKIEDWKKKFKLELEPDFQRNHVWTEEQQIAFVEFVLKGGKMNALQFNHPGWMNDFNLDGFCLVDGLQRITALLKFVDNKLPVFGGNFLNDFDNPSLLLQKYDIPMRINDLKSRKEVLKWYLEMNDGGTVHTKEEIEKVKKMLKKEENK
jgi:hypothetical protein